MKRIYEAFKFAVFSIILIDRWAERRQTEDRQTTDRQDTEKQTDSRQTVDRQTETYRPKKSPGVGA